MTDAWKREPIDHDEHLTVTPVPDQHGQSARTGEGRVNPGCFSSPKGRINPQVNWWVDDDHPARTEDSRGMNSRAAGAATECANAGCTHRGLSRAAHTIVDRVRVRLSTIVSL